MAGSYYHMVNDDGTPDENFGVGAGGLLNNFGDCQEALEDCYGMIWHLALAYLQETLGHEPTREEILIYINDASENANEGQARGESGR